MPIRSRLRLRVAIAFAVLGGVVTLVLTVFVAVAVHQLNQRVLDESLRAELEDYMARRARNPLSLPPDSALVRGYVLPSGTDPQGLPPELAERGPGNHALVIDGTPWRMAVADRHGSRYYLMFNEQRQVERERRFVQVLGGGVLLMIVLSAFGGWWLAGLVTRPVTELARRVHRSSPDDPALRLSEGFETDEVGDLARVFERYLDRLMGFIQRERDFTADVSHELRTPLAVIQGAVEVLEADESLTDPQRERLARIRRAVHEATETAQALLTLAREEAGDEAVTECPVLDVVREVVEKNRPLLRHKPVEIELHADGEPMVVGHPVLLRIVVGNLVRNAFAFTQSGRVVIDVAADRLTVRDTGSGIRGGDVGRLFERYYKGSDSSGSGIGLSLVRRICEHYGWLVAIEGEEGTGTTVTLLFDASSADV
ncbi:MAG: HAMP domain-containing sensor histidine kinase [Chromatiales bacterium]|jgi:signal transduction histidine kinase|nr:HAMP domain-containing sensor histidine kinase [Chromatiales bacterium]MDX9768505.1 HAMP domain-containing sensor histidine kinase [Ectothiorhodospiraceae bacterium]